MAAIKMKKTVVLGFVIGSCVLAISVHYVQSRVGVVARRCMSDCAARGTATRCMFARHAVVVAVPQRA